MTGLSNTFTTARRGLRVLKPPRDLEERRSEVLAEAAEAGKSIRYARRDFSSRKTRMTALQNPKRTTAASTKGLENIIYDFYSVLPSEVRHVIMSVRNRTASGLDRIRPEHLKNLPPVLIDTFARLFTRPNARFLSSGKPTRPCCCIKRETHMTSATIALTLTQLRRNRSWRPWKTKVFST
ncbi:hypothetical protein RB195_023816 [Necator americanus]|uniref:Reverse transcriptase domain-containing protein n=1 Tax=Necator americanus TaxID=51031 RepID=A0ABR1EMX4_NECAM